MAIRVTQNLRNKKILITAGPTWVSIDKVRVISNIATGETGILLAKILADLGARVTLLLGPVGLCCLSKKIRLIRFRFFAELKNTLIKELKSKEYDIVIHSAAVSDYRPKITYTQKVKSGKKIWRLKLMPTQKIIDLIKKIDDSLFLVGFKFEPGVKKEVLIKKAKDLMKRLGLDLAVANSINKDQYAAYIINGHKIYGPLGNKRFLAGKLVDVIGGNLWRN